jgi:SNF2 family DNA or RNA helicase
MKTIYTCKAVTRVDSLHIQSDTNANKSAKKESGLLSKSNTLLEIVKNMKEDSRYLIFSEYDGSFRRISYKLSERAIPFKVLTGNCNAQQKIIQQYKDGEVKILMLNATNFGAGLNLQMTTDIIIYHEFRSKDLKTQVIGRAQRPGRTCPLTVTYLEHET